jgi:hypothetical protein
VSPCLEAIGAVVDGVQARHVGEERLRRADVGGGLVVPAQIKFESKT